LVFDMAVLLLPAFTPWVAQVACRIFAVKVSIFFTSQSTKARTSGRVPSVQPWAT